MSDLHNNLTIDDETLFFAERLKKFRKLKNISQIDMAAECSITSNYLGSIEKGKHKCSLNTFYHYCKKLSYSADTILDLKEPDVLPELIQTLSELSEEQQTKILECLKILFTENKAVKK